MTEAKLLAALRLGAWVLAGIVAALLAWRACQARRGAGSWWSRGVLIPVASLLAVLLFAWAAQDPRAGQKPPEYPRIILLLDVSQSVLRGGRGWPDVQAKVIQRMEALAAQIAAGIRPRIPVTIATCGRESGVVRETSLAELSRHLGQVTEAQLVAGDATDLEAGLRLAGEALHEQPGLILLFSDGLQNIRDARKAALALAAHGAALDTFPLQGGPPVEGVTAFDLPPVAEEGHPITLRTVVTGKAPITGTLGLTFATASGARSAAPTAQSSFSLPQSPGLLPTPLVFQEHGLQCVQVTYGLPGGAFSQCLYTQVFHVAKVLSIGETSSLVDVLDGRAARIVAIEPEKVRPEDFEGDEYEAVVLDGVPAGALAAGVLAALTKAHEEKGTGILFINGPVAGEQTQQPVLSSYLPTPLAKLLPLKAQPRNFTPPAERRDNIFLVDVSGSMDSPPDGGAGGRRASRLQFAIESLSDVVQNLETPDHLYILPYAGTPYRAFDEDHMGPDEKKEALAYLRKLSAGGGTAADSAFQSLSNWISGRQLVRPKLFFITDGDINIMTVPFIKEFDKVLVVIDSEANFRAGSGSGILRDSSFKNKLDVIYLEGGSLARFSDKYFPKPIPFWQEASPFRPHAKPGAGLPMPAIALPGSALATLLPGAAVLADRPDSHGDPVFAERRDAVGGVIALASGIPPAARQPGELQEAAWSWVKSLMSDHDRYRARAEDRGSEVAVEIEVLPQAGVKPRLSSLEVSWKCHESGRAPYEETQMLLPTPQDPGVFRGAFHPPRGAMSQGSLFIDERGPDALGRAQRLPMALPPAVGASSRLNQEENRGQGLDDALLKELSTMTGGSFDPRSLPPLAPAAQAGRPLWPLLCLLGATFYLVAIWQRHWTPWGAA